MVRVQSGADFVVFIYQGGDLREGSAEGSWSVDSLLLIDTDVPHVLQWLHENLHVDSCSSLGVVVSPSNPTPTSDLNVVRPVGADVLNIKRSQMERKERRLADEMLARWHRVELP